MRWTIAVLALLAAGGCIYDSESGDVRFTVTNNTGQDLWLEVDDPVWGWRYVTEVEHGETLSLYFDDDIDGRKIRAQDDDDDTVSETRVRDDGSWTIGSGGGT